MTEEFEILINAEEPSTDGANLNIRYGKGMRVGSFSLANVADAVDNLLTQIHRVQPDLTILQQAGSALFAELFQRNVLSAWREAVALAHHAHNRLRLRIYSQHPSLISIPWEYLYDIEQTGWIALHPEISLVRAMPLATGEPLPVTENLRLLVMISSPNDLPKLDVTQEWLQLEHLANIASVELTRVAPTHAALMGALRQQPHIFHFIGHGKFDEITQQGVLYLCDEVGASVTLSADKLASLLGRHSTLRLALLNACQGATVASTSAFAGVAQRLIQAELPAVIAMQAPIVDDHALYFSHEFYRAMADGMTIEEAIGQGRKRINGMAATWGIPALYLQNNEPFAITPLSNTEKAERLWQRWQHMTDQMQRHKLVNQVLQLNPNHIGGQTAQQRMNNEEQASQLYATAESYIEHQKWREAHRTLEQIERLVSDFRKTRSLIAEMLGKLKNAELLIPSSHIDQNEEFRPMLNALLEGRLVPVLGWDVSRFGRPPKDSWARGQYLPDDVEIAQILAMRLSQDIKQSSTLPQISQYTRLLEGESVLYERLNELYDANYPPTSLHNLLAELPRRLHLLGYPSNRDRRIVIFSTAFDDLLEHAFIKAGQPYHLFAYRHNYLDHNGIMQHGRFVHILPDGKVIDRFIPAEYEGHDYNSNYESGGKPDRRPVIIKLCGKRISSEPDSVIVTEDQYLDYLPAQEISTLLPLTLLHQINRRSFVFWGYSLQPWHLRLLWQRMRFQQKHLHDKAWAILPKPNQIEQEFWRSENIVPIVASLEDTVAYINEWLQEIEARHNAT